MNHPPELIQGFNSAKGGQGTTVVASAVALIHANTGRRTLLIDAADRHDTYAALGMPEPADATETVTAAANLDVRSSDPDGPIEDIDGYDVVIIDAGQHRPRIGTATLVTRGCYLALRRAVALTQAPDNAILVCETGRALTRDDIAAVLTIEIVAAVPADPEIARVVDAGLLASRLPAALNALAPVLTAAETAGT